jgi:hypothetical protein
VVQEPELLLGQATPDPEDLPGAHRERPAQEHRCTAHADCLGQPDWLLRRSGTSTGRPAADCRQRRAPAQFGMGHSATRNADIVAGADRLAVRLSPQHGQRDPGHWQRPKA